MPRIGLGNRVRERVDAWQVRSPILHAIDLVLRALELRTDTLVLLAVDDLDTCL